jgi:hypothetical protein
MRSLNAFPTQLILQIWVRAIFSSL